MKNVSDAFRKLNTYFQYNFKVDFRSFSKMLNELVDAKIFIVDDKKSIVSSWPEGFYDVLPEEYLPLIAENILENVRIGVECCTAVPILCSNEPFTIIAVASNPSSGLKDEQIMILENAAAIFALKLNHKAEAERRNKALEIAKIRTVINVMSCSEVQATICILKALEGKSDGLLVASKIADNKRFTRSLIVNALRKLQSARLIESKSLGMKGTFIKILSPALFDEFRKKI